MPLARNFCLSLGPVLALCLLMAGCVSLPPPPVALGSGAVTPSLGYSGVDYPNRHDPDDIRIIQYDPDHVQIGEWHQRDDLSYNVTVSAFNVSLSLVGEGNSAYRKSYEEILAKNELDGLLNQIVDTKVWYLNLWVIKFANIHTIVGGTGYRIVDPGARESLPRAEAETAEDDQAES
ncbi:MAG: hypothetical protein PWP23_849 [Candidatus Sumerlaeota bacterium]|nr:hypothetical protein [Candidatus Sumerlaeota bacterium]